MTTLPGIKITNNGSCDTSDAKKIAALRVINDQDCDTSGVNKLPGINVKNDCDPCMDTTVAGILHDYSYIGYTAQLNTYLFEVTSNEYPATYWIIVDGNYEYVGIPIDLAQLVELLNDMGLGTWTISEDGESVTVRGYHNYGEMFYTDSEVVSVNNSMQPLFGTALNNIGYYYDSFTNSSIWNDFIETVGFAAGCYTVGAESRWIHYQSTRGGFSRIPIDEDLSDVDPNVGMRANPNEIYYYTEDLGNATDLHSDYNDTDVDFFAATIAYCLAHNQQFIFTANVSHGTTAELGQYLDDLIDAGVSIKVRYDNELSTGSTGADPLTTLTSDQYLAKVTEFHAFMQENYADIPTVINSALRNTLTWDIADIAAFAKEQNIPEFSQYLWLGDNAGQIPTANTSHNIDDYFTLAIENTRDSTADGNNSLYGEVVPRLQTYYDLFYPVKMHIGQYGCSLQRTGYVANTMLHGLMIWNELFEIWGFNYTHNNFVSSAVFLENESAVDLMTGQDNLFSIDSSLMVEDGDNTYVKRIQGVAYELLKPLSTYSAGYPKYVPVIIEGDDVGRFDVKAFVIGSEVYLFVYSFDLYTYISSIVIDENVYEGTMDVDGAYSNKFYGSVGSCPAYNYFKDFTVENPDLVPTDVLLIDNAGVYNVSLPWKSIARIRLTDISDADAITITVYED